MICILKIPQYRCMSFKQRSERDTVCEGSLFNVALWRGHSCKCVIKRESYGTEALECDGTEELIHNIHIDHHRYPPPLPSAPASHTHTSVSHTLTSALDFSNFQTLLAAFFHRIYILTNLATFLDKP